MPRTRPIDPTEARILGVLLEKEQATPGLYPLTLPALVAGCNQKSNREPVLALASEEVRAAVEKLQEDVLVWRTAGARAARYKHSLDRRWALDSESKALITLLLLRGPQTPGELRQRSERLHAFADVGAVEATLARMAAGFDAIVRELPREPGQRESRWMHLLAGDDPRPAVTATQAPATARAPREAPRPAPPSPSSEILARLDAVEAAVADLREELTALRHRLGDDG